VLRTSHVMTYYNGTLHLLYLVLRVLHYFAQLNQNCRILIWHVLLFTTRVKEGCVEIMTQFDTDVASKIVLRLGSWK